MANETKKSPSNPAVTVRRKGWVVNWLYLIKMYDETNVHAVLKMIVFDIYVCEIVWYHFYMIKKKNIKEIMI